MCDCVRVASLRASVGECLCACVMVCVRALKLTCWRACAFVLTCIREIELAYMGPCVPEYVCACQRVFVIAFLRVCVSERVLLFVCVLV